MAVGIKLKKRRTLPYKEQDLLKVVLEFLELDERIAWAKRMNTGAAVGYYEDKLGRKRRRFVRYGFKGLSDILGQAADGRLIAFETKRPGETASDDQLAFIELVNRFGGIAGVVYSLDEVLKLLDQASITPRVKHIPTFQLT